MRSEWSKAVLKSPAGLQMNFFPCLIQRTEFFFIPMDDKPPYSLVACKVFGFLFYLEFLVDASHLLNTVEDSFWRAIVEWSPDSSSTYDFALSCMLSIVTLWVILGCIIALFCILGQTFLVSNSVVSEGRH